MPWCGVRALRFFFLASLSSFAGALAVHSQFSPRAAHPGRDPTTMAADLAALRAYVTDPAGSAGLAQAASTVRLTVEHASLKARFVELRLDMHVSFSR